MLWKCIIAALSFFVAVWTSARADYLGNYTAHEVRDDGLLIHSGESQALVTVFENRIVRIALSPNGMAWPESSLVVAMAPENVSWQTANTDSSLVLQTSAMNITIGKYPLRFRFATNGGTVLQDEHGLLWEESVRGVRFRLAANERLYGGGERAVAINRRGQRLNSYNVPQYCYGNGTENLNITVPFFMSSERYGIYFDNPYPGIIDVGNTGTDVFDYRVSGGEFAYFVMVGDDYGDLLARYTSLTGRQPLPPRWALGYLQSRYGYTSETQAREVVQSFRSQGFPLDAIILDLYWFGWGQMGDFDWDGSHWPTPQAMMADFDSMNVKTILITEPYILQSSSSFAYTNNFGLLTPDATGTTVIMPSFWAGSAGLLDITDPAAQDWLWSKYDALIRQGVGGWWCDLGEPELHPSNMVHYSGTAAEVHNTFSLQWAKLLNERYRQHFPEQRLFNLIRSGYAGMQRYSTHPWSGDVQRSFSGLSAQLPIMLSMSLSGVAYIGSDLGGFDCGPQDSELYIRWMQLGAFSPIMRAHGVGIPTEPIYFDQTTREIARYYMLLRQQLLPYNYSLAYENSITGIPLTRPLFFADENDNTSNMCDEYSWGPSLLVAPVLEAGQTSRSVYLPSGTWIDFWTDVTHAGDQWIGTDAALSKIPLFVRAGSFIPMVPPRMSTAEYTGDTLELHYYPELAVPQSEYLLYEDDGADPSALELDLYAALRFRGHTEASRVTMQIEVVHDGYAGAPDWRQMRFVIHRIVGGPDSVCVDDVSLHTVASFEDYLEADSAVYWLEDEDRLYISVPWNMQAMILTINGASILENSEVMKAEPFEFTLEFNYPNPFNSATTLKFSVPHEGRVTLKVYDVLGRHTATLADEVLQAGNHIRLFDARNLSSGVYFAHLVMNDRHQCRKIVILR